MWRCSQRRWCSVCLGIALLGWGRTNGAFAAPTPQIAGTSPSGSVPKNSPADEIHALIRRLGDPDYATRVRAQEDLEDLGAAAFDQLLEAQDDQDIEVAQRARYLVRSIRIPWTESSDSNLVKSLLTNFATLNRQERRTRAEHLSKLPDNAGLAPLCRIVRYDYDRVLSKQAALFAISLPGELSPETAARRAQLIRAVVDGSTRPAAAWLRTYSHELEAPGTTLAEWEKLAQAESLVLANTPAQSDRQVARDLWRWHARLLLARQRPQEALASVRQTYGLIADNTQQIDEAMDWALEHRLWDVPEEIAARFAARVRVEPMLLYRLAESHLKRGQPAAAEKAATEARGLRTNQPAEHLATAALLQQRGLVDWACAEFRLVLSQAKVGSNENSEAALQLSLLLYDAARELEAAETIRPLVQFAEEQGKGQVRDSLAQMLRGNMHFWYGLHFGKQGDRDKQIDHLNRALENSPENIDILIAMYRVPQPEAAWRKNVLDRIQGHLDECRRQIQLLEETIKSMRPGLESNSANLATSYNELAWLIANTEGDRQEALRASHRSLELSPNNEAYLDTLGRCYFAAGDLPNAVKYQRLAVAATPHVQVMQRQLKLFEEALATQQGGRPPEKK